MFKKAEPLFLIVETPLHAGSGDDLGIVDLPIQREKHTDYPKIEASGLKGSLREVFEGQKSALPKALIDEFQTFNSENYEKQGIHPTFGPDKGDVYAGALGFTDARLLLFPVKSMKGVFAWLTCPAILERFRNDLELAKIKVPELGQLEQMVNKVPISSGLIVKENKIVVEEYTFEVTPDEACSKISLWLSTNVLPDGSEYAFWRNKMKTDIVILSNDDFRDFVTLSTEVIARTKIGETGTVEAGALWYEEYLPSDSIMYSLILASPIFNGDIKIFSDENRVLSFFKKGLPSIVQIGGNATLGKGLVRTKLWDGSNGRVK